MIDISIKSIDDENIKTNVLITQDQLSNALDCLDELRVELRNRLIKILENKNKKEKEND